MAWGGMEWYGRGIGEHGRGMAWRSMEVPAAPTRLIFALVMGFLHESYVGLPHGHYTYIGHAPHR